MPYEYRVLIAYRSSDQAAGPRLLFQDRQKAEAWAAKLTPPKYTRAWVERRCVGEWEPLDKPEP